jgi:plastocyanin
MRGVSQPRFPPRDTGPFRPNRSAESNQRPASYQKVMRRFLILLPIALLLGACGGETDESEPTGDVLQTIQIAENEFSLEPSTVSLPSTGTYAFEVTNNGQVTHALEIEEHGGAEAESDDIEPGETKTLRFTFSSEGSHEMYCPIGNHRDEGMDGTITVGAGAGGGGTTTDEDETETETNGDTTTGQTTTDGY